MNQRKTVKMQTNVCYLHSTPSLIVEQPSLPIRT